MNIYNIRSTLRSSSILFIFSVLCFSAAMSFAQTGGEDTNNSNKRVWGYDLALILRKAAIDGPDAIEQTFAVVSAGALENLTTFNQRSRRAVSFNENSPPAVEELLKSTVIVLGHYPGEEPVLGFYNPLVDGWMIAHVRYLKDRDWALDALDFYAGEVIRKDAWVGEIYAGWTRAHQLPEWTFEDMLIDLTADSFRSFAELYPSNEQAYAIRLPSAIKFILSERIQNLQMELEYVTEDADAPCHTHFNVVDHLLESGIEVLSAKERELFEPHVLSSLEDVRSVGRQAFEDFYIERKMVLANKAGDACVMIYGDSGKVDLGLIFIYAVEEPSRDDLMAKYMYIVPIRRDSEYTGASDE